MEEHPGFAAAVALVAVAGFRTRFPEGPLPTEIVKEVPTRYSDAADQSGKLTGPMNVVVEHHHRLQELIWLDERGAPPDILWEHLGAVDGSTEYPRRDYRPGYCPGSGRRQDQRPGSTRASTTWC